MFNKSVVCDIQFFFPESMCDSKTSNEECIQVAKLQNKNKNKNSLFYCLNYISSPKEEITAYQSTLATSTLIKLFVKMLKISPKNILWKKMEIL